MLLMNDVLICYRMVGAADSQFVLLSYFTNIVDISLKAICLDCIICTCLLRAHKL